MKGKTLVRIGGVWLGLIIVAFCLLAFLVPFMANQFLGLGVELPLSARLFSPRVAVFLYLAIGYSVLLGWIPFLSIGLIRIFRERKARFIDNPSLNS